MASYTIQEINDFLDGELLGNTTQLIEGPEELKNAENHQANCTLFFFGHGIFICQHSYHSLLQIK